MIVEFYTKNTRIIKTYWGSGSTVLSGLIIEMFLFTDFECIIRPTLYSIGFGEWQFFGKEVGHEMGSNNHG